SAARPDGAMQRRSAVLILQMEIRAVVKKAVNGLDLPLGVPCRARDEAVCGVMQWGAPAHVACRVGISARGQQQTGNLNPVARSRQMQQGIANVNPVEDM